LPYTPELHFEDFKSKVADMKNACGNDRKGPPTATAGLFVFSHVDFAKDVKWLHIDIAFPSFVQVINRWPKLMANAIIVVIR
jgi:leucyl aminopeptidase